LLWKKKEAKGGGVDPLLAGEDEGSILLFLGSLFNEGEMPQILLPRQQAGQDALLRDTFHLLEAMQIAVLVSGLVVPHSS
jgi:hypothetical protein